MISTIHDTTIVNKGRKDRKTNMEIKKPYAVGQYNKFIEHRQGRPVPQLLLGFEENCKMVQKGGTIPAKLCALQWIFVYRTLNTNKVKDKNFAHKVGRSWISEVQIAVSQVLMTFNC